MNEKIDLVILAGGKGSRIKKFLKNKPKPLAIFNKKYFLSYIINNLSKYNFENIYILTKYKSQKIFKIYHKKNKNFTKITCLKEKKFMDTGGALNVLKKKVNDFVLVNGDTIFDIDIIQLIKTQKKNYLGVMSVIKKNINDNKLNNIKLTNNNIINFSKKNNLTNGGVYFFKKRILKYIPNKICSLENDILNKLIKENKILGKKFNNFFIDIGTKDNFAIAKKRLKNYFYRPAAFLDRDGVINYENGYISNFKKFRFKNGVIKGLKYLIKKNYYIFIVTNQAGIAKNKITIRNFFKLHKKIKRFLQKKNIFINDIQYCPYHPQAVIKSYKKNSNFRKPGNLMIKKIIKNWDINLSKSFMIGDKKTDEICAKKSNILFEYAKNNFFFQIKRLTSTINSCS
jgi:D-glycero-D-manno-heptose 1,7-bisphosphate phosphatase